MDFSEVTRSAFRRSMFRMLEALAILLIAVAWVGHAYILTTLLNNLYAHPLPKKFLKPWRHITGLLILAFPVLVWRVVTVRPELIDAEVLSLYLVVCLIFGLLYPFINLARYLRKPPACVLAEETCTLDLWPEYGEKLIGDGIGPSLTRLPGNCVFKLDVTDLTLAMERLPPEWDGLRLQVVSDLHFHGTPSRVYFDRLIDELTAGPPPDLVCLVGDYLDTDTHHEWIVPLLGRLQANEAKLAILGNHDKYHDPDRARAELAAAGYTVLGNGWKEIAIRGVPCVAVGHEGPWFRPPDLSGAPEAPFRLCLSHTPDNFYWGLANGIDLMFCGHVHGGGIRLPFIGSIFVPSRYGRRFDYGVFEEDGTVMAVNRGVSGKEPIRIRCNPQVFRVTLRAANRPSS
jgi:predicted MPP superfamily phosphohydrolase